MAPATHKRSQPHAAAKGAPPQAAAGDDVEVPAGAVQIDGSMLEGGGQILRNATALAAITGRAVCVSCIRAGEGVGPHRSSLVAGGL